jgi:hypothetical protein
MALPRQLRKEALDAVIGLMDGPLPAGEPYEPVPDTPTGWRPSTSQSSIAWRAMRSTSCTCGRTAERT